MRTKGKQATSEQSITKQVPQRQNAGKQKTYVYSQEAIAVLEEAKESGCKLNEFISEAIIEYGKQKLVSTDGLDLKQRVINLERVLTSIGIKQLHSLVRIQKIQKGKLKTMMKCVSDNQFSPHDAEVEKLYKRCARRVDVFATKEELPLWWIIFYATHNNFKIEE